MAQTPANALQQIIDLCHEKLTAVQIVRYTDRGHIALLEIQAQYGDYRLHVTEIWQADGERKYAYYALQADEVIAGFDNAPDPQALRLKYGASYTKYRQERIPHQHTARKENLILTNEFSFAEFLDWLAENLAQ